MTLSSALSLVFKTIPRSLVVGTFGIVWVLGGLWDGGGVSDEMGGVANVKVLAFSRVEVQLPISGPAGVDG